MACKDGELLAAPRAKINGTMLFAQKAPDKYDRPRMVLDFSNILHKSGGRSPLYARVLDVDNARETVRNNEILGIVQPHASTKTSLAISALGDLAIANAKAGTKWSHRIDPYIDRERDWVSTDLLFIGTAKAYANVERPAAPRKAANATGDQILTDGKMSVLDLGPSKALMSGR